MNIGSIGKAIANQAMDTAKNSVLDAVRTPTSAKPGESKAAESRPPLAPPTDIGAAIVGQIQAMQRPLKEDQELAVQFCAGDEMLRITEIIVPNPEVLVFAGLDGQGNITRVISPVGTAQVICRILKVAPGVAPSRVNVLTPRPQPKQGS